MAQPFFTPVRRNHIVGPAGVGSLLVTRSGITVLICGLATWLDRAPARGPDEPARRADRERLIQAHELHDSNAERDLSVSRFLTPPVVDDEPRHGVTWFVPATRFPLAEYCHNPSCKALGFASSESPSVGRCTLCGDKRPSRRQQVPIVMICPAGHLDEVDFNALVHPNGPCAANPRLTYQVGQNITAPEIRCLDCLARERVDPKELVACTGARPWLPGKPRETCAEKMMILDRTSTAVYFPDVRSYLHIPAEGRLRDAVLRWLEDDPIAVALRRVPGNAAAHQILDRARPYFPDLTAPALAEHLAHLNAPATHDQGREGELVALMSGQRGTHTADGPPVLDAELIDPSRFNPAYIGPNAPITRVVAVHRLAETRALSGFTRVEPPTRVPHGSTGYHLLWGHRPEEVATHDWLPGMRVYGEGILLELNPDKVRSWAKQADQHLAPITLHGELLNASFQLAHTVAHLLMNAAALQCGYPVASLRDRIYSFPGNTSLLLYTGEGDVLGTMGGLVELAQPGYLEPLLETAYSNARWCGLDPVCLNPVQHIRQDHAGACHQCCLLPETSCGWWNEGLDRATLVGRSALTGYLEQ